MLPYSLPRLPYVKQSHRNHTCPVPTNIANQTANLPNPVLSRPTRHGGLHEMRAKRFHALRATY